jgi:hypothetical protein
MGPPQIPQDAQNLGGCTRPNLTANVEIGEPVQRIMCYNFGGFDHYASECMKYK